MSGDSYVEWGKGLSIEQYKTRESILADSSFGRSALVVWVLIAEEEEEKSDATILASCETYKREAVLVWADAAGRIDRKNIDVWSVASVFVPEMHRNKGYATLAMKQLLVILHGMSNGHNETTSVEEIAPFFNASTLYSDIGKAFYARLGWVVYPSYSAIGMLSSDRSIECRSELLLKLAIHMVDVTAQDVHNIAEHDRQVTNRQLNALVPKKECAFFCIPFSEDCFQWFISRATFYTQTMSTIIPHRFGVRLITSCQSETITIAWILWIQYPHVSTLCILRHFIDNDALCKYLEMHTQNYQDVRENIILMLLRAAEEEATKHALTKIEMYAPNKDVQVLIVNTRSFALCAQWSIQERDQSISSLHCWRNGNTVLHQPANTNEVAKDTQHNIMTVEWIGNERYAWV